MKGAKFSRAQLEEAYRYVISRKRQQWNAGIATRLHEVEQGVTEVKGAMDELKGVQKSLKSDVKGIFDSSYKEVAAEILAWAEKLQNEKKNFIRVRQEERQKF